MAKKLAKDLVTIDRRNNKDRRDVRADKAALPKKALAKSSKKAVEADVIDDVEEIEEVAAPVSIPAMERRAKVNRRRQIDPTTCERDYSGDEIEFMAAMDEYKRKNGRMFPTCSEILEVIRSLGYERTERSAPIATATAQDDIDE